MKLSLAFIAVMVASTFPMNGQSASPVPQKVSLSVALNLQKDKVPIGQSPWAILTIENLDSQEVAIHDFMWRVHEVAIHDFMWRVHVDRKDGEAPTTYIQRWRTRTLRPGEPDLRGDEWVIWSIWPGKTDGKKIQLTDFYDLSAPGKYSVYAEVEDPVSQKWLRTNTRYFEMEAATQ